MLHTPENQQESCFHDVGNPKEIYTSSKQIQVWSLSICEFSTSKLVGDDFIVPLKPGVLATPPALPWSVVQSDQDRISLVDLEKELITQSIYKMQQVGRYLVTGDPPKLNI